VPTTFGAGLASRGAAISLRGLGAGSTLVLLYGRRMAPSAWPKKGKRSSPT
jgi:iron complex outermembrane receptor protein